MLLYRKLGTCDKMKNKKYNTVETCSKSTKQR